MPTIKHVWPRDHQVNCRIGIQHDNAPIHFDQDTPEWIEYVNESMNNGRWDFFIKQQPPNSPDLNILDLGLFRAIQFLQTQQSPSKTMPQLISNVQKTWDEYDPKVLNRIWLSHGHVMNEIVRNDGNNEYDLPHFSKEKEEREGRLETVVQLDFDAETALEDYQMYDLFEDDEDY
jgi:hypothetical protein